MLFTPTYVPRSSMAHATPLGKLTSQRGLRFTELFFLAGMAWAFFFSVSAPLFGFQLQISFLKHVPLMFLLPAIALHFYGNLLNRNELAFGPILGLVWPLVLLAVFVISGSLVARTLLDIDDTFLTFGLYLLLLPVFAAMPARKEAQESWAKAVMLMMLVTALAASVGQLARVPDTQWLHEIEFLVFTPLLVFWFLGRNILVRFFGLLFAVAMMIVNYKLTGFILAAAGLMYIVISYGWRRVGSTWKAPYLVVMLMAMLLTAGILAVLYFEFRELLPTGSPEVRLMQYEIAFKQFLASPVWGTAFADGAGESYQEMNRLYNIPTHSDIIDMLKHGGLIGLGLFLFGYWRIFWLVVQAAFATQQERVLHAFFVVAAFFQVGAFLTFAVNPLLLKAPFLIVIWGTLGLAVGLALRVRARSADAGVEA